MSRTTKNSQNTHSLGKIPKKHKKKFTRYDGRPFIEVKGMLKRHWRKKNIRHEANQLRKSDELDTNLFPV